MSIAYVAHQFRAFVGGYKPLSERRFHILAKRACL